MGVGHRGRTYIESDMMTSSAPMESLAIPSLLLADLANGGISDFNIADLNFANYEKGNTSFLLLYSTATVSRQ